MGFALMNRACTIKIGKMNATPPTLKNSKLVRGLIDGHADNRAQQEVEGRDFPRFLLKTWYR